MTSSSKRPGGHKKPRLLSPPLGRRSFVRVDMHLMQAAATGELSDAEFRAWLGLLTYVARFRGEANPRDGEFPRDWAKYTSYAKPRGRGRVTPKQLERFIELGLLEPLIDEDGKEWLRVVDWRDVHPLEWTGAIRQASHRERHGLYGRRPRRPGDPMPTDAELLRRAIRDAEIAVIEEEGRVLGEELAERQRRFELEAAVERRIAEAHDDSWSE